MAAKIKFIVAYSQNRVIGKNNQLPWHLPDDLRHFKRLSLNQIILMGRKTYESIGRALPDRTMVVLTRNRNFTSTYARAIHSVAEIFQFANDVFVIGGAEIYQSLLPYADSIYATEVQTTLEGDAFFPVLASEEWQEISREPHLQDNKHLYNYSYVEYKRVQAD